LLRASATLAAPLPVKPLKRKPVVLGGVAYMGKDGKPTGQDTAGVPSLLPLLV